MPLPRSHVRELDVVDMLIRISSIEQDESTPLSAPTASAAVGHVIGQGSVALADRPFGGVRPGDGEQRVVPADTCCRSRRVGDRDHVRDVGVVDECLEPVGASLRDVERPSVVRVELDAEPRPRVGEPARRSTATSKIAPRVHRTSFASSCGARWKCRPRSVPARRFRDRLHCASSLDRPAAVISSRHHVRANEPRSSTCSSSSTTTTPARAVSTNRTSTSGPAQIRAERALVEQVPQLTEPDVERPSNVSSVRPTSRYAPTSSSAPLRASHSSTRSGNVRPSAVKSTRYERGSGDASPANSTSHPVTSASISARSRTR